MYKKFLQTLKNTEKLRLDIDDIAKIFLRLKSGVTADINLSLGMILKKEM